MLISLVPYTLSNFALSTKDKKQGNNICIFAKIFLKALKRMCPESFGFKSLTLLCLYEPLLRNPSLRDLIISADLAHDVGRC